jgi:hypothetical protein
MGTVMQKVAGFAAVAVFSIAVLGGVTVAVPGAHLGATVVQADGADDDPGTPGQPTPPPTPSYRPDTWGWGG